MLLGEKVRYCGNDAVVLVCLEDEVLVFVGKGLTKWVERRFVEQYPIPA
jgi:hypothetical protein